MFKPTELALAVAFALASSHAFALNTEFDNFTPLTASAGPLPVAGESTPITLSSPQFSQKTVAERNVQLGLGQFHSGATDMITMNTTGPDAGRYLFTPFESGQSGIQRTDLVTGQSRTIWRSPSVGGHVAFDASYWTPWRACPMKASSSIPLAACTTSTKPTAVRCTASTRPPVSGITTSMAV